MAHLGNDVGVAINHRGLSAGDHMHLTLPEISEGHSAGTQGRQKILATGEMTIRCLFLQRMFWQCNVHNCNYYVAFIFLQSNLRTPHHKFGTCSHSDSKPKNIFF